MKELQRRQTLRKALYSVPSLIIIFVISVLFIRGAINMVGKERESAQIRDNLEQKSLELVERESELKEGIDRLKTIEGTRGEIRDKFTVTEEGEYVAIIIDPKSLDNSSTTGKTAWYKRLWNVIVGSK